MRLPVLIIIKGERYTVLRLDTSERFASSSPRRTVSDVWGGINDVTFDGVSEVRGEPR